MNQRVGRYLALIVLLGAVGTISAVTLASLDREPEAAVTKVQSAARIIAYQVFQHRGPSFRLAGTTLKLVSNVVVDGYDPLRVTSYGFRLTARHGDREIWSRDVYLQSRESKGRWENGQWRDEAAWGVDPIGLTDERIAIINLPDRTASATLSIRLLGAPREAVIRLFGEEVRTEAERQTALRRLDPTERDDLIRSSTYLPWQLLPFAEQYSRLRRRWVRMAAVGDSGFDVTTRTIYVTDFRLVVPPESKDGIELSRDRDIAINVLGPAYLSLAAVSGRIGELEVVHRSAAGLQRLPISDFGGIHVSSGPGTLVISTARSEPMRFRLTGAERAQIVSEESRSAVPGELVPDRVNSSLVICGPRSPMTVPVRAVARMPLLGRGFRIDARVVVTDPGDFSEAALAFMTVAHLAPNGQELRVDQVVVGGPASRFERLAIGGGTAHVADPTSVRVVAVPGADRIELRADRDVGLRVYRWAPAPQVVDAPYRDLTVPEHRWRYARLAERSWFPMLMEAPAGGAIRVAQLEAQVRLEPIPDSDNRVEAPDYQTLVPVGRPEQQRAREPVPADMIADALTAWPVGCRTRIAVGVERSIDFRSTFASRPRLSWVADSGAVGSELEVMVDDVRIPVAMTSRIGAVLLPRIAPGRHRVRVEGRATEVWIDRPPTDGGAGVARDRTLYRLTSDGLAVRVLQRADESVHVYAIIYAQSPSASNATSFVMTVDRGRVARRSGISDKLTSAEVRSPMPEARRTQPAVLVDLGGQSAGLPRSMGIGILSDVKEGWHTVDLRRSGTTDVWVRFVTTRSTRKSPALPVIRSSDFGLATEQVGD